MDKFVINGPVKLQGSVEISGAKNAVLPIMTACLAYPGIYTTSVVLDTSLLNLIITDQLRYSNVMVTFEGSPLGIDGSYIPITMQTTNAIEVQAAITIQIDTGALDIEP